MKIVNLLQRGDEWLAWRKIGVSATDAIVLLNRSKYKTIWRLWAEKTGYAREVDISGNPLVRKGLENEDQVRIAFESAQNEILLPVCVESSDYPLMRASLDGLTESGEPVELKCPSESVWKEVCALGTNSSAYRLYYAQVQHQLLVTGASNGWLVFGFNGLIKEFKVTRDEALIRDLIICAAEFWSQVVARKEPVKDPERDLYIPQGDDVQRWIASAEEYRLYESEVEALKKRLEILKERQKPLLENMKLLMGEYYLADYCGLMVTRYRTKGKVNYRKLLEDRTSTIDEDIIDSYREATSERCRVTVTGSVKPRYIVDEDTIAPLEDLPELVETSWF